MEIKKINKKLDFDVEAQGALFPWCVSCKADLWLMETEYKKRLNPQGRYGKCYYWKTVSTSDTSFRL